MQLAQIFSCALFCDLSADPFPAAAPAPPTSATPPGNRYKPPVAKTAVAPMRAPQAPSTALLPAASLLS